MNRKRVSSSITGGEGVSIESEGVRRLHHHDVVLSLVRRFDQPQKYKPFVSWCVVHGNLEAGTLRQVDVKSALPAATSMESLERLDDHEHVLSMRIIGGSDRLRVSKSALRFPLVLHTEVYSISLWTCRGNTEDETCYFLEALIKCNLKSLAEVSERLAGQDQSESINCL
ncbi:hypothetical protein MLD38_030428 [Melastoma candidum]|uniref:Uncharacterized protein n=1 Tax=Melastoma candidum TaxID=119954 RepID=A0ACB9MQ78_9MYRT|nr:hypothetical protein MLD38_030428 [Melastoma candidum]